jgi:hypothetical protein
MKTMIHSCPPFFWSHDEFFQALGTQIALIHLRQLVDKNRLIVRFDNGYGVSLLPMALEEDDEVFEMVVIRFFGPRIHDYKVVQYAPVPEFNRDNFDRIINLCRQVSLLPQSQAITIASGQSEPKINRRECQPSCGNFL